MFLLITLIKYSTNHRKCYIDPNFQVVMYAAKDLPWTSSQTILIQDVNYLKEINHTINSLQHHA